MALFTKRIKRDFLDSCAGIQSGSLRLTTPEGEVYSFGAGAPEAELTLHDWSVVTATMARGDIGLGETYVAGLLDAGRSPALRAALDAGPGVPCRPHLRAARALAPSPRGERASTS